MFPRIVPLSLAAFAAAPLQAQTVTPLMRVGDPVTGVGTVTGVQRMSVNDAGDWVIEVDTNNTTTTIDEVLIKNGVLFQQQGQPLAQPANSTLVELNGQSLRNNGDTLFNWTLSGTAGGTSDNAGLYLNHQLVLQKGATPMDTGWNPGTVYSSFSWAKLNSANQICLRGIAPDPVSTPTSDWFISLIQLDGANNAISEIVLARAGQALPGQTSGILTIRSAQDANGFNNLGHAIYGASLASPEPTATNSVIYLWNGTTNVLLAQKGMPSPVAGINWGDIVSPELALNDAGDWVIKDLLDTAGATDGIIVKNNAKLIQEGDTLPAIGGTFVFTTFSNAPVSLTDSGSVCWYGDWSDPATTIDTGIFLDHDLMVQKGVTMTTDGFTFNSLLTTGTSSTAGMNNALYVSPNSRFVIFGARQSNNVLGVYLLDRGSPITSYCSGDGSGTACPCGNSGAAGNGCANSLNAAGANLAATGSASVAAADLVLTATGMGDSSCLFFQGTTQVNGCAGATFGDGLRCVGGTIVRLGIKVITGGTAQYPAAGDASIAAKGMIPPAGGVTQHYQCWYRNAQPFCMPETFNLTNALSVPWVP